MKMKQEHFKVLETRIKKILKRKGEFMYREYQELGYSDTRYNWDLLWESGMSGFMTNQLYPYLDDDHINTALKRITGKRK